MRIIAFIDQPEVIEAILFHLGLWPGSSHSPPGRRGCLNGGPQAQSHPCPLPPAAYPRLGSATRSGSRHPPRLLPFARGSDHITSPGFPSAFRLTRPGEPTTIPPWLSRGKRNNG
jgi:hypothetical protein